VQSARSFDPLSPPARDDKAWQVLTEQIGVGGLGLPERVGGLGGLPELVAVAEVLGANLLPVPFFSSTVLAGQILARCGPSAQAVLEAIAAGQTATVAALTGAGTWDAAQTPFRTTENGRLHGTAVAVLDALGARWIVAAAGDTLTLVDTRQPACTVTPLQTLDLARPQCRVTLSGADGVRLTDVASTIVPPALDVARLALAADQLGGAQQCLDRTVAYVRDRHQFGRAIGSFQAVKHALADILVHVEMGRSALDRALETGDDPAGLAEAASVALVWCSGAYRYATAETVQLHGGIGFTWEHDAHLYFRRARADSSLLGSVSYHRERLAELLDW
jgi:alkylation response protein AidB-like acyl-CoA dehydrogenase